MGLVTPPPATSGRRAFAPTREEKRDRIDIVDNPLAAENPGLGRALEQEIRRLLADEAIGTVEVRFRVCRDDSDGFRFICKVENPPCDAENGRVQWRWWSPLMQSVEEFREALSDGLRIRRERLSGRAYHSA